MERLLTTVLPHCKILREFLFSAMLLETKLDFFYISGVHLVLWANDARSAIAPNRWWLVVLMDRVSR